VRSRRQRNVEKVISSLRSYDPQKIILFGSHARGDDDRYSDLDLVVIKETDERFLDRLETIYDLVQPDFALDVLVYTSQELADMRDRGSAFAEKVLEEGVVVYERPGE